MLHSSLGQHSRSSLSHFPWEHTWNLPIFSDFEEFKIWILISSLLCIVKSCLVGVNHIFFTRIDVMFTWILIVKFWQSVNETKKQLLVQISVRQSKDSWFESQSRIFQWMGNSVCFDNLNFLGQFLCLVLGDRTDHQSLSFPLKILPCDQGILESLSILWL
jgi:hypothetical protein